MAVFTASRSEGLSIGRLAERTGVNLETIRYYERVGMLPAPPRTRGGHRVYGREHVMRLNFVRRSRELGFPLRDVRALLRLVDGGDNTCAQVRDLTERQLVEVRRKIADLGRLERVLADMVAACQGGTVPECPAIDALSGEDAGLNRCPGARSRRGRASP
jgi:MerR family mercuric resistance operon transcriptional regulator